jgi:hypothetical protein
VQVTREPSSPQVLRNPGLKRKLGLVICGGKQACPAPSTVFPSISPDPEVSYKVTPQSIPLGACHACLSGHMTPPRAGWEPGMGQETPWKGWGLRWIFLIQGWGQERGDKKASRRRLLLLCRVEEAQDRKKSPVAAPWRGLVLCLFHLCLK